MADIDYQFDIKNLNYDSQRHLIRLIAGIFVLTGLLAIFLGWFADQLITSVIIVEAIAISLQVLVLNLIDRSQWLVRASRLCIYSNLVCRMAVIFLTAGIFSPSIYFLPVYPMLGVILLRQRESLLILAIQVLSISCLGWMQVSGYSFLPAPTQFSQIVAATIGLVSVFLFVAVAFSYSMKLNSHLSEKILTMANHDYLTEVLNRRAIDNKLATEIQRAKRDKTWLTVMMIDVDYFKLYNDQHGHLKGDNCLQIIARTLKDNLRNPPDSIGRYGGEEFLLILPNTDSNSALHVAERIQQSIKNQNLGFGINNSKKLTVTTGLVTTQILPDDTPEVLISIADKGLYKGKADGRDCIVHIERSFNSEGKPQLNHFTRACVG